MRQRSWALCTAGTRARTRLRTTGTKSGTRPGTTISTLELRHNRLLPQNWHGLAWTRPMTRPTASSTASS